MTAAVRPQRLDDQGHALFRLIERRRDAIPERVNTIQGAERLFKASLDRARFVNREDEKLTTWVVLGDVLISVNGGGIVTTVHPERAVTAADA